MNAATATVGSSDGQHPKEEATIAVAATQGQESKAAVVRNGSVVIPTRKIYK